jgi:hypothetical protein
MHTRTDEMRSTAELASGGCTTLRVPISMQTKVHNRKTTNYLGGRRYTPPNKTSRINLQQQHRELQATSTSTKTHNSTKKLVSLRSKLELSTNFLNIKTSGKKKIRKNSSLQQSKRASVAAKNIAKNQLPTRNMQAGGQ